MNSFLLNSLSAHAQCKTIEEAHQAIRDVVECFKYLSPALRSKRRKLIVDASIEHRNITHGMSVVQAINCLSNKTDRDTRNSWFLYTKKQAARASSNLIKITIKSADPDCTQSISEESTSDFLIKDGGLISFGGCELTTSKTLRVYANGENFATENAHALAHLQRLLPSYEASPKHRKDAYYDHDRREQVAAMPLPPDVAHEVLLAGVPHGDDYVGLHGPTGKFIRFKLTGGNEYHGFEVQDSEVSPAIQNQLRPKR